MSSPYVRSQRRILVAAPAALAFRLFTPKAEELWIDDWRPRYLRPGDGSTTPGMVFTTGEGAEFTVWQLLEFDPQARRSVYVRTTPASRAGTVSVQANPLDLSHTEVTVQYEMTALRPDADPMLDAYREPAFGRMIEQWERSIRERMPQLVAALA